MYNVLTLDDSEAVSNPNYGYMNRHVIINAYFTCIIGDNVEQWSTNTLSAAVTIN